MTTTLIDFQNEIDEIVLEISQTPYLGACKLLEFLYRNPTVAALECFIDKDINFNDIKTNRGDPLWYELIHDLYNPQLLERLLKLGVNVNQWSSYETPLTIASTCYSPKFCEILLNHGANISVYNRRGCQPIHCAASAGCDSTLNYLLSRGANVNAMSPTGLTPLHLSVTSRLDGVCKSPVLYSLVKAGADVNAVDTGGRNAFYVALQTGNIPILFDLVTCGIKFQIFSSYGRAFWQNRIATAVLSTNEIDQISALYYMSGETVDWKPRFPNFDDIETRFWKNCTRGCHTPAFSEQCNQVINRTSDELVTTCVGLQSLQLPSLVLCEIISEVLACWGRIKFCEIWNRVVAVRHFHERHF